MKNLLTAVFAFLFSLSAKAQMAEPVKWTFNAEKIEGTEYKITLTATIQDGWYVYSQDLPSKGPIPTQIKFEQSPNLVLEGKPQELGVRKEIFDQNFNMTVIKLMGKTEYVQRVKIVNGTPSVKGKLTYMTCNGEMCMPPKKIDFNIAISN